LYFTTRPGSMPHDAVNTSFGVQSSIRVSSALAAKPYPRNAPHPRARRPSIAMTGSGIIACDDDSVALADTRGAYGGRQLGHLGRAARGMCSFLRL